MPHLAPPSGDAHSYHWITDGPRRLPYAITVVSHAGQTRRRWLGDRLDSLRTRSAAFNQNAPYPRHDARLTGSRAKFKRSVTNANITGRGVCTTSGTIGRRFWRCLFHAVRFFDSDGNGSDNSKNRRQLGDNKLENGCRVRGRKV